MATPVEELRAALAVAELEEQLAAAKAGDGADMALKLAVREARRVYREMREARPAEEGEARPGAIEAGVAVNTSEVN